MAIPVQRRDLLSVFGGREQMMASELGEVNLVRLPL